MDDEFELRDRVDDSRFQANALALAAHLAKAHRFHLGLPPRFRRRLRDRCQCGLAGERHLAPLVGHSASRFSFSTARRSARFSFVRGSGNALRSRRKNVGMSSSSFGSGLRRSLAGHFRPRDIRDVRDCRCRLWFRRRCYRRRDQLVGRFALSLGDRLLQSPPLPLKLGRCGSLCGSPSPPWPWRVLRVHQPARLPPTRPCR